MSKQDKRNGKESGHWQPSRWTDKKLRRYMRHVCKVAWNQCCTIIGAQEGTRAIHAFLADAKDRESAAWLAAKGVRTIGDVQRGA